MSALPPRLGPVPRSSLDFASTGKVVSVADGDTLTVLVGKAQHKVRFHGIDCPERKQPVGTKAKQFNDVVDDWRKNITRKYKVQLSKAERKRFRALMWEFRRDPKDLKPEEQNALQGLFAELPVLKDLYDVRVRFKEIFDTAPDRAMAEEQLAELR